MAWRIILRPHVPDDIEESLLYFEAAGVGLGDTFVEAVFASLQMISEFPGIGSPKLFRSSRLSGIRSWGVKGFRNYLIYYRFNSEAVIVLGVIHGSRDIRSLLRERSSAGS